MKRYSFYEFLLRLVSLIAETAAAYLVYLFFQQWAHLPAIAMPWLVLAGVAGMLVSGLSFKGLSEQMLSGITTGAGIVLSVGLSIVIGNGSRVEGIFFLAVFLLFIWSRGVKSCKCEYVEIYRINVFYFYIGYFIFINFLVFVVGFMEAIGPEVARYTVLYIVLSLFMLFQMKSEKYLKKTKADKKLSFDLVLTMGMIAVTLLLSTPKATAILIIPIRFVYGLLLKAILIIALPIGYAMEVVAKHVSSGFGDMFRRMAGLMGKNGYKPKVKFEDQYYNPQLINSITRFIAIVILIIVAVVILKGIMRYMQKLNKRRVNDEFTEEKEFVTGMGTGRLSSYLKNAGSKLSGVVGRAVFRLSADNREKLRYEYSIFVNKIYGKNIIEKQNHTAQNILELLREKYPESGESLDNITQCYELVRYGTKQPANEELREFKKNIGNILKAL